MARSVDNLANTVSRWILAEPDEVRKKAYIIANTTPADSDMLQRYLLNRISFSDTPGTLQLRAGLTATDMTHLQTTTLPWVQVWSYVGVELCTRIGPELKPGEHAHLFHQLGILAIESER